MKMLRIPNSRKISTTSCQGICHQFLSSSSAELDYCTLSVDGCPVCSVPAATPNSDLFFTRVCWCNPWIQGGYYF
uniref:Uncharacterized protein n=1 Tax=Octopus bimaculoides TaxID=37653 RepID=A0A0L8GRG3_OCTBM